MEDTFLKVFCWAGMLCYAYAGLYFFRDWLVERRHYQRVVKEWEKRWEAGTANVDDMDSIWDAASKKRLDLPKRKSL